MEVSTSSGDTSSANDLAGYSRVTVYKGGTLVNGVVKNPADTCVMSSGSKSSVACLAPGYPNSGIECFTDSGTEIKNFNDVVNFIQVEYPPPSPPPSPPIFYQDENGVTIKCTRLHR